MGGPVQPSMLFYGEHAGVILPSDPWSETAWTEAKSKKKFQLKILKSLNFKYHPSTCNAVDLGSISGSGRSPGEGNDNLLQYSCLRNPMDRGACWATVCGMTKSQT